MTGEITLRGRVLPIGGLKEKLLAAHRGELKTVIIPKDNEKDLTDIPRNVRNELEIVMVESVDEVLKVAFVPDEEEVKLPEGEKVSETGSTPDTSGKTCRKNNGIGKRFYAWN